MNSIWLVCYFMTCLFCCIRHDLRCFWDHARSAMGSRWVWLQRRVAELNKQIYRLDHHMKESCSQDKFMFESVPAPASTAATTATASVLPQYMSLTNGSMLEHLRAGSGGGGLIPAAGLKPSMGTNGFLHHPHTTGHAQCLPLILPEGLLGTKLQVKDLLSPSPIDRSLLFVNETSCSAARTRYVVFINPMGRIMTLNPHRPLVHRASRRVIRKKALRTRNVAHSADVAFHPHLSMAHGESSNISCIA